MEVPTEENWDAIEVASDCVLVPTAKNCEAIEVASAAVEADSAAVLAPTAVNWAWSVADDAPTEASASASETVDWDRVLVDTPSVETTPEREFREVESVCVLVPTEEN